MKKILFLFISLFLLIPFASAKTTTTELIRDKINVYVFYSESCPHCKELHSFLDTLSKDELYSSKFEIVDFEVSKSDDNLNLMRIIGSYFDTDVSGVPFYVIGNKYYSGYSSELSDETIKTAIDSEYFNDNYLDVIAGVNDGSIKESELYTTIAATNQIYEDKFEGITIQNVLLYAIITVVVLAVIIIILLQFFDKLKTK